MLKWEVVFVDRRSHQDVKEGSWIYAKESILKSIHTKNALISAKKGWAVITQVEAKLLGNWLPANITLNALGPGYSSAKLTFVSERGQDINYNVTLYGFQN